MRHAFPEHARARKSYHARVARYRTPSVGPCAHDNAIAKDAKLEATPTAHTRRTRPPPFHVSAFRSASLPRPQYICPDGEELSARKRACAISTFQPLKHSKAAAMLVRAEADLLHNVSMEGRVTAALARR